MASLHRRSIAFAVLSGFLGVALGAFGAHALRPMLEAGGRLAAWQTAVEYQLIHAVAMLALGLQLRQTPDGRTSRRLRRAGDLFALGVLLFSGSIYLLALGAPRWIGPVTPVGGLCLLAGWAALGHALLPERGTTK